MPWLASPHRYTQIFRLIPRCSHLTDMVSPACPGSFLGPPPSGTCLERPWAESPGPNTCGVFWNYPIRDIVERLLQINSNSVNMTSKSNICQMKVALESLIDDHVFPLNQCARLWEEIYFNWSCDWTRDCKILSSYEKGSRGVILVLSGPKLHPTYEFLSKAESMKSRSFLGLLQFQHTISELKWIILRVFLHLYVLYACAYEDHFYSYCRSWVSPWFKYIV